MNPSTQNQAIYVEEDQTLTHQIPDSEDQDPDAPAVDGVAPEDRTSPEQVLSDDPNPAEPKDIEDLGYQVEPENPPHIGKLWFEEHETDQFCSHTQNPFGNAFNNTGLAEKAGMPRLSITPVLQPPGIAYSQMTALDKRQILDYGYGLHYRIGIDTGGDRIADITVPVINSAGQNAIIPKPVAEDQNTYIINGVRYAFLPRLETLPGLYLEEIPVPKAESVRGIKRIAIIKTIHGGVIEITNDQSGHKDAMDYTKIWCRRPKGYGQTLQYRSHEQFERSLSAKSMKWLLREEISESTLAALKRLNPNRSDVSKFLTQQDISGIFTALADPKTEIAASEGPRYMANLQCITPGEQMQEALQTANRFILREFSKSTISNTFASSVSDPQTMLDLFSQQIRYNLGDRAAKLIRRKFLGATTRERQTLNLPSIHANNSIASQIIMGHKYISQSHTPAYLRENIPGSTGSIDPTFTSHNSRAGLTLACSRVFNIAAVEKDGFLWNLPALEVKNNAGESEAIPVADLQDEIITFDDEPGFGIVNLEFGPITQDQADNANYNIENSANLRSRASATGLLDANQDPVRGSMATHMNRLANTNLNNDGTTNSGDLPRVVCVARVSRKPLSPASAAGNAKVAICTIGANTHEDAVVVSESFANKTRVYAQRIHRIDTTQSENPKIIYTNQISEKDLEHIQPAQKRAKILEEVKNSIGPDGIILPNTEISEGSILRIGITRYEDHSETYFRQAPPHMSGWVVSVKTISEEQSDTESLHANYDKKEWGDLPNQVTEITVADTPALNVGDKITLDGVKGIISKILADQDMPLTSKFSRKLDADIGWLKDYAGRIDTNLALPRDLKRARRIAEKYLPDTAKLADEALISRVRAEPEGKIAEVVINPRSLIARMTISPLIEMQLADGAERAIAEMTEIAGMVQKWNVVSEEQNLRMQSLLYNFTDQDTYKSIYQGEDIPSDIRKAARYIMLTPANQHQLRVPEVCKQQELARIREDLQISATDGEHEITISGQKVEGKVAMGDCQIIVLNHRAAAKTGSIDLDVRSNRVDQTISKVRNDNNPVKYGLMETYALLAHGAKGIMREFRNRAIAQKSNFMQRDLLAGQDIDTEAPKVSRSEEVLRHYLLATGFTKDRNSGMVRPASATEIIAGAQGEVKYHSNYSHLDGINPDNRDVPANTGLHSQNIFGPTHGTNCGCGNMTLYSKSEELTGSVCGRCGEQILSANSSRDRYGYITLPTPVINPAGGYQLIRSLLGITQKEMSFRARNDVAGLKKDLIEMQAKMLRVNINTPLDLELAKDEKIQDSARIENLKWLSAHPEYCPADLILSVICVPPSCLRRGFQAGGSTLRFEDQLDHGYHEILELSWKASLNPNDETIARQTQETVRKLIFGRYGKEMGEGLACRIVGKKSGIIARNLYSSVIGGASRGVITPAEDLKIGEIGLPHATAKKLYLPIVKRALQKKLKINPEDKAADEKLQIDLNNPDGKWKTLITNAMRIYPVIAARYPTLHKHNLQGMMPVLNQDPGDLTIRLEPTSCPGFGADFDGDAMGVSLIVTAAGRREAVYLLSPAANLRKTGTGEPNYMPQKEAICGLAMLHQKNPGQIQKALAEVSTNDNQVVNRKIQGILRKRGAFDKKRLSHLTEEIIANASPETAINMICKLRDLGFAAAQKMGFDTTLGTIGALQKSFKQDLGKAKSEPSAAEKSNPDESESALISRAVAELHHGQDVLGSIKSKDPAVQKLILNIKSGGLASTSQMLRILHQLGLPLGVTGKPGNEIIRESIFDGLSIHSLFANRTAVTAALAHTQEALPKGGFLAMQLRQACQDMVIRDQDCGIKPGKIYILEGEKRSLALGHRLSDTGETINHKVLEDLMDTNQKIKIRANLDIGVESEIEKESAIGMVLAAKSGKHRAGTVITEANIAAISEQSQNFIISARSPSSCMARLCQKCTKPGEDASATIIGEGVGANSAKAVTELLTQAALSKFHLGGAASSATDPDDSANDAILEFSRNFGRTQDYQGAVENKYPTLQEVYNNSQGGHHQKVHATTGRLRQIMEHHGFGSAKTEHMRIITARMLENDGIIDVFGSCRQADPVSAMFLGSNPKPLLSGFCTKNNDLGFSIHRIEEILNPHQDDGSQKTSKLPIEPELHYLTHLGDKANIADAVKENPGLAKQVDHLGQNALFSAKSLAVVEALVEAGVNPVQKDSAGTTPIDIFAFRGLKNPAERTKILRTLTRAKQGGLERAA